MFNVSRLWHVLLVVSLLVNIFLGSPEQKNLSLLADGNVLLLTAHPDDECMFFAPTVLALSEALHPPSTVYSLCLSVGNADGLGDVRRRELEGSLDVLGIGEGRRWVVDKPELQDNFTAEWDPHVVSDVLRSYVLEHHITTILTFDHHGISSHPNHISLPKGASHLINSLRSAPGKPQPRLFTLVTVPLRAKYVGLLSPLLSKASIFLSQVLHVADVPRSEAVVVSDWKGYVRAHRAMRQHSSQLVWFRWLYVLWSRYMWVNEWVELVPPDQTQSAG
ncbi:LmbE-like protein [Lentinus brumalis]|uniref:N-acetylglucosaminylphosphatidylinositol deacetylase n=1 Tax=Lentinus brumalis TaxID=2498619 RepID=A0A371D3X2_9APHY|nr:LmbE-like protein [Polyporus brumalis]